MTAFLQHGRPMNTYSLYGMATGLAAHKRHATHRAVAWLYGMLQTMLLLCLLHQVPLLTHALQVK